MLDYNENEMPNYLKIKHNTTQHFQSTGTSSKQNTEYTYNNLILIFILFYEVFIITKKKIQKKTNHNKIFNKK